MTVGQLVAQKKDVVSSIHPDALLSEALKILDDSNIEVLMVVNEHQHIEGIVSKKDILYKYSTAHGRAQPMSIKDMMTPHEHIIVVQKGDDVRTALAVMNEQSIQHLPIFDEDKVCALVSMDDVVKAFATETVNKMVTNFINGK